MEAVAVVITLASFAAFVFGVVNVIYPLKALRIRKRLVGLFIILGSMVGCVGGASLGVAASPGGWTAAIEKSEAERKAAEPNRPAQPVTAAALKPEALTQMEFSILWGSAGTVMERCNVPVRAVAEAVGTGDQYAAYPLVGRAEAGCADAASRLRRLDLPKSAKGEVRAALQKAREDCARAADIKGQAMTQLGVVINGDMRPSAVTDAKAANERGQLANLVCMGAFSTAAEKAGLELITPDKVKPE